MQQILHHHGGFATSSEQREARRARGEARLYLHRSPYVGCSFMPAHDLLYRSAYETRYSHTPGTGPMPGHRGRGRVLPDEAFARADVSGGSGRIWARDRSQSGDCSVRLSIRRVVVGKSVARVHGCIRDRSQDWRRGESFAIKKGAEWHLKIIEDHTGVFLIPTTAHSALWVLSSSCTSLYFPYSFCGAFQDVVRSPYN